MTQKNSNENPLNFKFQDLLRPLIARVPAQFRVAVLQKELDWNKSTLKSILVLWSVWYIFLICFSDTQKDRVNAISYALIRLSTVALSVVSVILLKKVKLNKKKVSYMSFFLSFAWMMSYTSFSYLPLSIRTSWVTILPASFLMTTVSTGSISLFLYGITVAIGLIAFHQPINTIYIISDLLFGGIIICSGFIVKRLWVTTLVANFEREETERRALENEIKMFEALQSFIPRAVKNKINAKVRAGAAVSSVVEELANPIHQHLAVLYSDYRNYSLQSGSVDFIKNELITSSGPIIDLAETNDGFIQNRGDSIIAAFMDQTPICNIARAIVTGLCSAKFEFDRIKSKGQKTPARYMIITSGEGVFCSLGTEKRQEITIAGKPANLAARLDEVTKKDEIKSHLNGSPSIIIDFETRKTLIKEGIDLPCLEIDLKMHKLEIRTYESERRIFIVEHSEKTVVILNELIKQIVNFERGVA